MKKILMIVTALIFLVAVIFLIISYVSDLGKIEVVSVSPTLQIANVPLKTIIKIDFDKKPVGINFTINPNVSVSESFAEKSLILKPVKALEPGTVYNVYLYKNSKLLFSWYFKTREKTEEDVIKEETKLTEQYYPLINFLPYSTDSFQIKYIGNLSLRVAYVGNVDVVKQQVLDWIKSRRINPATHQIEWVEQKAGEINF